MLDRIDERARRFVGFGIVTTVIGLLLFAGLWSSAVVVVIAAVCVVGVPLIQLWDDRVEPATKRAIGIYLAVMAFWLAVKPLSLGWGVSDLGNVLRWIAVMLGPVYIWAGISSLRVLPAARSALNEPTYDVLLEISILKGYGTIPSAQVRLWPSDPLMAPRPGEVAPALAQFSWQASEPQLVEVDKAPAKVHRAPTKGAVVVVSCQEAVLVGRVKRSHFGETPTPPKPMSPLMAWLWKPRRLRVP